MLLRSSSQGPELPEALPGSAVGKEGIFNPWQMRAFSWVLSAAYQEQLYPTSQDPRIKSPFDANITGGRNPQIPAALGSIVEALDKEFPVETGAVSVLRLRRYIPRPGGYTEHIDEGAKDYRFTLSFRGNGWFWCDGKRMRMNPGDMSALNNGVGESEPKPPHKSEVLSPDQLILVYGREILAAN